MDIRMDTEDGYDVVDDEILDASEVEVVEEPMIPDAQMRPPPMAPKKPCRKKPLLIAAVVFLIIVCSLIVYIFIPRPPTDIDIITTESGDGHGVRLNALISSESATESSGKATIKISFDGTETYSNSNWKIDSNSDSMTIPYKEFVMGNGEYTIDVEFEGVSDTTTYEVNFVIEDTEILAENAHLDAITFDPEFDLKVLMKTQKNVDSKNAEIKIVSVEHMDEAYQITSGVGDWRTFTGLQFIETLEYQQSGNYTVTVTIRNGDVKSTSEFYEKEHSGDIMTNAGPIAVIETTEGDGTQDGKVKLTGTTTEERTVTFDARSSKDDSVANNHLVIYDWLFEDTQKHEYGAVVDHTFNSRNPDQDAEGMWTIILTITDNGHGEDGKYDSEITLIEVTL